MTLFPPLPKKLKHEVLGGGTVEGYLEPGEVLADSVYDMADLCEDAEDTVESGECRDLSAWRVGAISHNQI